MASVATLERGGSIPRDGAWYAKWGRSRVPSGGRVATPQPIRIPIANVACRSTTAARCRPPSRLIARLAPVLVRVWWRHGEQLTPPARACSTPHARERTRLGLPLRARRRSVLSYGGRRCKVRRSPDGTWRHRGGWRASDPPTSGLVSAASVHRPRRRNLATGLLPGPAHVRCSHQASWALATHASSSAACILNREDQAKCHRVVAPRRASETRSRPVHCPSPARPFLAGPWSRLSTLRGVTRRVTTAESRS